MQQSDVKSLWVCWRKPAEEIPPGAVVLSFLPPDVEEELAKTVRLERARELSQEIRPDARRAYLDLVAAIGIADCGGKTFRQRLEKRGVGSMWWYHPVAFRDCESDPTFNHLIAILTIGAFADRMGIRDLVVIGGESEVVAVLRSRFQVTERNTTRGGRWLQVVKSIGRRIYDGLRQCAFIIRPIHLPSGPIAIFLSAFWDWSFELRDDGSINDRYYRDLPRQIERHGPGSAGWLVWIDSTEKVALSRARSLANRGENSAPIVSLQSLLRVSEVLKAYSNLNPLFPFVRFRKALSKAATDGAYDFAPLFTFRLLCGFLNESLPHAELVVLATERAHRRYQPKGFVSFLEHFPHARAGYRGISQAGSVTTRFAVQHASYNRDKTFLPLEPRIEFGGHPDGFRVPRPDFVFAMGELGRELFLECGYPEDRVLLTGSPRYDTDRTRRAPHRTGSPSGATELLMVSTLNLSLELEMVNAVVAASRDIPQLRLRFRNHPLRRIEKLAEFNQYRSVVEITSGSLEDDLASSDLIVFTYSTVAEEAFVAGKPVWQWLPLGFDGSALAEVVSISRFGSVQRLRDALIQFKSAPQLFTPTTALSEMAERRLFFNHEGGAAARVAASISRILSDTGRLNVADSELPIHAGAV